VATEGMAPSGIARVVARLAGWPRSEIYDLVARQDQDL